MVIIADFMWLVQVLQHFRFQMEKMVWFGNF